jgi:hypothetical protein
MRLRIGMVKEKKCKRCGMVGKRGGSPFMSSNVLMDEGCGRERTMRSVQDELGQACVAEEQQLGSTWIMEAKEGSLSKGVGVEGGMEDIGNSRCIAGNDARRVKDEQRLPSLSLLPISTS